jgi:hypothetical protein
MMAIGTSLASAADPVGTDADATRYLQEGMVVKYVLVAGTFRSYPGAVSDTQALARRVGLEYRRKTTQIEDGSPTYSRTECEANGWAYPCYVARGRYDDGTYFSVEPSSSYHEMQPGYFVALAASGTLNDVLQAQRRLSDQHVASLVRRVRVWMGFIH